MYQELVSIISNREVMPGIRLLRVESPHLASEAKPGQFVMITCDSSRERILRRPISIHGVNQDSLDFLFATIGPGTEWLAQRQAGEKIDILGPVGNGFSLDSQSHSLLMVAGGMGIAPMVYLASEALRKNYQVKLLAGAKNADLILPVSFIPKGCDYTIATEDGSLGEKGLVTAFMPRYTEWADQIFICGPLPMYKAIVKSLLPALQSKPVQVSLEVRMGCGMGFCYACTIKTRQGLKQVCKDGPVFQLNDVVWEELK